MELTAAGRPRKNHFWPFKYMAPGDVAVVRGVSFESARQRAYLKTYQTGARFQTIRASDATIIRRLNDDGTDPGRPATAIKLELDTTKPSVPQRTEWERQHLARLPVRRVPRYEIEF